MKAEQRRALEILARCPQPMLQLARTLSPERSMAMHAKLVELIRNGHAELRHSGLADTNPTLHITAKGLSVIKRQPKQQEKNS